MNLKTLFTYNYQFYVNSVMLDSGDKLFPVLGGILILLAIVLKIAAVLSPNPVDEKYRNSFFRGLLFAGIWEIVWFGFRWQNIRFFGSHFVAWLGLLVGLVWIVFAAIKMIARYAKEKTVWEKERVKLKYLPK